jgi:hypothetical protein
MFPIIYPFNGFEKDFKFKSRRKGGLSLKFVELLNDETKRGSSLVVVHVTYFGHSGLLRCTCALWGREVRKLRRFVALSNRRDRFRHVG